MQLEIKKLIYDIDQAVTLITDFTAGKQITNYVADPMLVFEMYLPADAM